MTTIDRDAQHVTIAQGEAVEIRIPVVDADGVAVTLTGAAISWRVTDRHGAIVLTHTTAGGGVTLETTDDTDDTVVVTLAPEDTEGLEGTYDHEAAITGAQAGRIARGYLLIQGSSVL